MAPRQILSRTPLFLASLALALPAWADNLAAHQHGQALLQIAVEGQTADVVLTSPAHNVLGFEHQPSSHDEHERLEAALAWFDATALITSPDLNCELALSATDTPLAEADGHHHDEHEHDHHDAPEHEEDHHAEHGEDHHGDHHDDGATHSDIEVSQQVRCDGNLAGKQVQTPLLDQFEGMEELQVEWLSENAQGTARLHKGDAAFRLAADQ